MANEHEGVSPASAGGAPARQPVPEPFRRMFWVAAEDIANVIGCTVVEGEARGYGEPDPRDTDPGKLREIANALHALLGEEDCTERAVTPGHLWYLVRLVAGHLDAISDRNRPGPPKLDPRDAEIEQLRTALAIEQRDLLNEMDEHRTAGALLAEAREEWKRVDAEVTRLKRLVANEDAEVAKERDRWQANYNRLIGGALAVQQHLQRALGKPVPAGEEFDKDYSRSMVDGLKAERDRLRQELDLIGEKHAAGLVTLRMDFTAAVNGLMPKPAEPRRFYAHSPEPEVGTVVGLPDRKPGGPTWTRHPAGGWQRSNSPGYRMAWKSLFGDRGELVEVSASTTDGEVPS